MYHSTLGLKVTGKKEEGRSNPAMQSWEDLCLKDEWDGHALRRGTLAGGVGRVSKSKCFEIISAENGRGQCKNLAVSGKSVPLDSCLIESSA